MYNLYMKVNILGCSLGCILRKFSDPRAGDYKSKSQVFVFQEEPLLADEFNTILIFILVFFNFSQKNSPKYLLLAKYPDNFMYLPFTLLLFLAISHLEMHTEQKEASKSLTIRLNIPFSSCVCHVLSF